MKYIEKKNPKAIRIVDYLIKCSWNKQEKGYPVIDYTRLSTTKFNEILLCEQDYLCCYCMRKINIRKKDKNLTLEHIIPHTNITEDEFNAYIATSDVLKENVVYTPTFLNTDTQQKTPPAPHVVAYHNLTASCDGRILDKNSAICCNNKRGKKKIVPLFYRENIETEIEYKKGGILFPRIYEPDSIEYKTIENVYLNDPSLQNIRKMWYLISRQYTLKDVKSAFNNQEVRNDMLTHILDLSKSNDIKLQSTFINPTYWNILWDYRWFYDYYKLRFTPTRE